MVVRHRWHRARIPWRGDQERAWHVGNLDGVVAGEGAEFEDAGEDPVGPPPDPDDRLWRHPSEMAAAASPVPRPVSAIPLPDQVRRRPSGRLLGAVLMAAAAGAILSAGLIYATAHPWGRGGPSAPAGSAPSAPPSGSQAGTGGTAAPSFPVQVGPGVRSMVTGILPSLVAIDVAGPAGDRRGTGFVYQSDGMVLTSSRLVAGATTITVTSHDGRQWNADVVGTDSDSGVALIRVPATGLHAIPLGSPSPLRVGQITMAVSESRQPGGGPNVAMGAIDAIDQQVDVGSSSFSDTIETDAPPLNVLGGVVVDDNGRVVALLQGTVNEGSTVRSVAVPATAFEDNLASLANSGIAVRSWLGVTGVDLGLPEARTLGLPGGALVQQVEAGSPASRAGLRAGDVITAVDGQVVTSMTELRDALRPMQPGAVATLSIDRGNKILQLRATLAGQPAQ